MKFYSLLPQSTLEWGMCALGAVAGYVFLLLVLVFGTLFY